MANPSKRTTRRGIKRFINGWLARQQERVGENTPDKPKYHNRPVAPPGSAERAAMERMMARRLERERRQV
ncbi:MAG: hypothetical protein FWF86_09350 [Clostridia bacterium]|nr:hypothetical protein [Clostridia bacterium]